MPVVRVTEYVPSAAVVAVCGVAAPVPATVTVTVAPPIAPPCGSVTRPLTGAFCAKAAVEQSNVRYGNYEGKACKHGRE